MTERTKKNTKIRVGALLMALLVSASLLTGCGNSKQAKTHVPKTTQSQSQSAAGDSKSSKTESSSTRR